MSEQRKLLCRSGAFFTRDAVFQTADGLEIDSTEHYEIVRRRVFFDDVQLVTYHSDRGVWYLVGTGLFGALFTAMGIFIVALNFQAWPASIVFFIFGIPADLLFLSRLILGRDVISVFGRRSKAVLRFGAIRRRRAREVYGQICSAVRRAQQQQTPSFPEPPPEPLPVGVPLPPR